MMYSVGKNCQRGLSLPEVLVALLMVSLAIAGVIRAITGSVANSRFSQEQDKASVLARQKVAEEVKLKDGDPKTYFSSLPKATVYSLDGSSQYCFSVAVSDSSSGLLTLIPTTSPSYLSSRMAQITVNVFWNWKGSGSISCNSSTANNTNYSHSAKVETYVTN